MSRLTPPRSEDAPSLPTDAVFAVIQPYLDYLARTIAEQLTSQRARETESQLMTIPELAAFLHLRVDRCYELTRRSDGIPVTRIGRRKYVDRQAARNWLQEQQTRPLVPELDHRYTSRKQQSRKDSDDRTRTPPTQTASQPDAKSPRARTAHSLVLGQPVRAGRTNHFRTHGTIDSIDHQNPDANNPNP